MPELDDINPILVSKNGHVHLPDDVDPAIRRHLPDFGAVEKTAGGRFSSVSSRSAGYGVSGGLYDELGRTGLRHWGGFVFEEWLRELQTGRRAAEVYREMADSDPIIGAILYVIEMLVRRVDWWMEPAGTTPEDQANADFMWSVLNDTYHSFEDMVAEILSFLPYGWAYFETVFKRRLGASSDPRRKSKWDDGKIGLRKLGVRSQDSLWKWVFDDDDEMIGLIQNPPPDYQIRFIPYEKALLFRTKAVKDNPEGRLLALDCPVLTTDGWSTMETIRPGDTVFDESGTPRAVTAKSEIFRNRPVYEVVFSSGHRVRADAVHPWSVTTTNDRTNTKPPRLLTTQQMAEWMSTTDPHFCCGAAPILRQPEAELPVDPYLLGYWLGDGSEAKAAFSVHDRDLPHLRREVERCGFFGKRTGSGRGFDFSVRGGLLAQLRGAGVLGRKHVPTAYLRASEEQRVALLQGLMDSDGYSSPASAKDRASKFANTDEGLIEAVCDLVRSLGGQPRVRIMEKVGSVGGTIRGRVVTSTRDVYEVAFFLNQAVHRLPRKLDRQYRARTNRNCGHFIKSIRRVENADTVCIEVDSPSHLFLAGRGLVPTHNSILRNSYRPWYFLKQLQNIEGIGIERDLAGLPVLQPPEGVDIWNANDPAMVGMAAAAKNVVSSIRRDEQEGVLIPFGWDLRLLSTGGRRQLDINETIVRYEQRIATSVLADVVLLGMDKVGSYALASEKVALLGYSIGAYLDAIANVINTRLTPQIFALNGMSGGTDFPQLCHGAVETLDLETLGSFLTGMANAANAGMFAGSDGVATMAALYKRAGLPAPANDIPGIGPDTPDASGTAEPADSPEDAAAAADRRMPKGETRLAKPVLG